MEPESGTLSVVINGAPSIPAPSPSGMARFKLDPEL